MERTRENVRDLLNEMEGYVKKAKECGCKINDILEGNKKISAVVDYEFYDMMDGMLNGGITAEEAYEQISNDGYFMDAGI